MMSVKFSRILVFSQIYFPFDVNYVKYNSDWYQQKVFCTVTINDFKYLEEKVEDTIEDNQQETSSQ